jgi:hypothetical protein
MSRFVTNVVAGSFLVVTIAATALLWFLGDWENYGWGLDLTLRILWGCCIVAVLAAALTRVTIIGWYFRRYFRPAERAGPPPPDPVGGTVPRRPARAPWYKSGALSFSMTVGLVSVTGAVAVAAAVIWVLGDVFGDDLMWLILKILIGVWWVACIALVLTRVGVFRLGMLRGRRAAAKIQNETEHHPVEK